LFKNRWICWNFFVKNLYQCRQIKIYQVVCGVMLMRSVTLTACKVALVCSAKADPTQNYYEAAANKTGAELKSALHDIIDDH
tara:strand:- start:256 stop:501 length:246 start_codon:yes stop_codon:yes gene_type:complete